MLTKILTVIGILVGLLGSFVAFGVFSQHRGFDQGFQVAENIYRLKSDTSIAMSAHGPRLYEFTAATYRCIAGAFIVWALFQLTTLFSPRAKLWYLISTLGSVACAGLIVYEASLMFSLRSQRHAELFLSEPRDILLVDAVTHDWLFLALAGLLLLRELGLRPFEWRDLNN